MKRKWKWRSKKLALWILIIVLGICKYLWPFQIDLKNPNVLEISKCPGCYGQNLCPQILKGSISLTNWSLSKYLFNAKNTFFAQYNGKRVILKKLAHDHELVEFDQQMCDLVQPRNCDNIGNNVRFLTSLWTSTPDLDQGLDFYTIKNNVPEAIETFTCVKNQDLVNYLVKRTIKYHVKLENFLTLSFINPEPLIAMAFPKAENWPFPEYYGSCGRFAMFENCGQTLNQFTTSDWTKKARLSLQVLDMALKFTFNEPIRLYLTDWSLDNFAVSQTLRVTLIDLENIVLVNKTLINEIKAPGWNTEHHSVAFGCENRCFSYSLEDLCSHTTSDHNIFGACQTVIQPLLLDEIPEEVKRRFNLIERLLTECTWPTNPGGRIEAAKQLRDVLKLI